MVPPSPKITVSSVADTAANDGVCTLREAIIAANTNTASGAAAGECAAGAAGLDTIAFAIPGAGVKTITQAIGAAGDHRGGLHQWLHPAGASANTNALNAGINAVVLIEFPGASGDGIGGLIIQCRTGPSSAASTSMGVGDQITINASNVTIAGNFLGTNPAGTARGCADCGGFGIRLESCCPVVPGAGDNIVIGGPAAADRNLISGNLQGGIFLGFGNGALIQGNYIGTDITGTVALITLGGVGIGGIPDSTTTIVGNLISGNDSGGVVI